MERISKNPRARACAPRGLGKQSQRHHIKPENHSLPPYHISFYLKIIMKNLDKMRGGAACF